MCIYRLVAGNYGESKTEVKMSYDFGAFNTLDELRQHLEDLLDLKAITESKIVLAKQVQKFLSGKCEFSKFDIQGIAVLGTYDGQPLLAYHDFEVQYVLWGDNYLHKVKYYANLESCRREVAKLLGRRLTHTAWQEIVLSVEKTSGWRDISSHIEEVTGMADYYKEIWVYIECVKPIPLVWDTPNEDVAVDDADDNEDTELTAPYTEKYTITMRFEPPYAHNQLPCENLMIMSRIFETAKNGKYSLIIPPKDTDSCWIFVYQGVGFYRNSWHRSLGSGITDVNYEFSNQKHIRIQMPYGCREQYVVWEKDNWDDPERFIGTFCEFDAAQNVAIGYAKRLLCNNAPDFFSIKKKEMLFGEEYDKLSECERAKLLDSPYTMELCFEAPAINTWHKDIHILVLELYKISTDTAKSSSRYSLTVLPNSIDSFWIYTREGIGFMRQYWREKDGVVRQLRYSYTDDRIYEVRITEDGLYRVYIEQSLNSFNTLFIGEFTKLEEVEARVFSRLSGYLKKPGNFNQLLEKSGDNAGRKI